MIETTIPLWGLITFGVVQIGGFAWTVIKLYFGKIETDKELISMKAKQKELETENKELKEMIKGISDTLIAVKNNTELLMLGRIKTSGR